MNIDVVSLADRSPGWAPITHLGELAARMYGGDLLSLDTRIPLSRMAKIIGLRPRKPASGEAGGVLAILHGPNDLFALRNSEHFRRRRDFLAIWIIDSFHHDRIALKAAYRDIDLIAVSRQNDLDVFSERTGRPVICLPWGSDVYGMGLFPLGRGMDDPIAKPVDLMRLGRQPAGWTNEALRDAAKQLKIGFSEPPPLAAEPEKNQTRVMNALKACKFILANSNLASPAPYTHSTEEYLTARWMDALACGVSVVGVPPRSDRTMSLIWPESLVELENTDLQVCLDTVKPQIDAWTPLRARKNWSLALERLDWRWRLKTIADYFSVATPKLDQDLKDIGRILSAAPWASGRMAS